MAQRSVRSVRPLRLASEQTESAFGIENIQREDIVRLVNTANQSFCNVRVSRYLASLLLSANTENRPTRKTRVAEFVSILKGARWINTGEPVIMSAKGPMNEGQHRLKAIVESGIPAEMDIRFGIARQAMAVTGTGAARTAGDLLALAGFSDPNKMAASIKLAIGYKAGLPQHFRWFLGHDLILKQAQEWSDFGRAIRVQTSELGGRYFLNAASGCFTWLALRQSKSEEEVREFLSQVRSGETGAARHPCRQLHDRMTNDLEFRMGGREVLVEKLALYIVAWDLWRKGNSSQQLTWKKTDPFPVMEGVKI